VPRVPAARALQAQLDDVRCCAVGAQLGTGYTIVGMAWGAGELESEVEKWLLEDLDDQQYGQALMHLDLLEEQGIALGMPYSRQLDGKLYELRFYCGGCTAVHQLLDRTRAPDRHADGVPQDQAPRDG
jgi:hypothetical protein